ncbi:MAG TPA: ParB/RepB/Spo0J family partition protein [Acidisarcina sp.]|nr:ParB/RepB/Spo0J family partition protein [Acidisarcina sp.]
MEQVARIRNGKNRTAATTAKNNPDGSTVVREIPLEQLSVSAQEARRTIDQAALRDLAASIAAHGVQEPLLVRPIGVDAYEIVAGQRRHAASRLAGKASCPCIVREMADAEARELGIVSNLQREDLPPLESASFVGRRLKLLDAIAPVREALAAGAIDVGHALELARLSPEQQQRMLDWLDVGFNPRDTDDDDEDDEAEEFAEAGVCRYCDCTEENACGACEVDGAPCSWANAERTVCNRPGCVEQWNADRGVTAWRPTRWSLSELRSRIAERTLRVLSDAPFPLGLDWAPMACTVCPRRSTNAALLFEDVAQDTCTDGDCFSGKVRAWIRHELDNAELEKRPLLQLSDGYSSATGAIPDYSVVLIEKQNLPCSSQEEAIWISGRRAGHAVQICRDEKCKKHKGQSHYTGPAKDPEKAKAERKKLLEKVNAEKKYRMALFAAVAQAPLVALYASDLNLEVCLYAIGRGPGQYGVKVAEALGWPADIFGWGGTRQLREGMAGLAPTERLRVALLAAHAGELAVNEYALHSKPEDLEKLAGCLSLDVKRIRAESAGKVQPEPAEPAKAKAKAKAPQQKKGLTAAAKKRIAAVQKKRWAARKSTGKGGKG